MNAKDEGLADSQSASPKPLPDEESQHVDYDSARTAQQGPRLCFAAARGRTTRALDPDLAQDLTISEFKALLDRSRATQHRGPAGTKTDEEPHKNDWALIPAEIDWAAPACSCLPSDKKTEQPPFHAQYAHRPLVRHRAIHSVARMSAMVALDLDNHSREQVDAILDRIEADGLDFSAWSTHTYGRLDRPLECPARIIVYADSSYSPSYAAAVRRGLAARYGIGLDAQANSAITLFYFPSCPDDSARIALSWIRHSRARGLLAPMSVVSEGDRRTQARRTEKAIRARTEMVSTGTASLEHKRVASERLEAFAKSIESHREEHIRERLRGAYYYGQYAGAGAMDVLEAERRLLTALGVRRKELAEDEAQHASRVAVVVDQLQRGFTVPALPDIDEEADALERLQTMLDEGVGRRAIPATAVPAVIRAALDGRNPDDLLVLQVTPGARKTGTTLEVIARNAEGGKPSLMLAPRHNLIRELRDRVTVPSRSYRSPAASDVEGEPNCVSVMKPQAAQAARLGLNISKTVCKVCPYRFGCELYRRERVEALVHFGAHQLPVRVVSAHHDDVQVYVDEMPELVEASPFRSQEESDAAIRQPLDFTFVDNTAVFPLDALHRAYCANQLPDPLQLMGAYSVELKLKDGTAPAAAFAHADTVRTLRVLRAIKLWARGAAIGEPFVWNELALHLKRNGGVLLTATPNTAMLNRLGARSLTLTIDVADAHPTSRTVLLRAEASRRFVEPDKKVDGAAVTRVWNDVRDRAAAAGVRKLVCFSYKSTVAFLEALPADPRFESVAFAYYGNVTGLNTWASFDGYVTLFDPWPPGTSLEEQAASARAELCQAHGRARDPNRENGAWHLHVGRLPPLGWHSDNTAIERTVRGAPKGAPQKSKRSARFGLPASVLSMNELFALDKRTAG